MKVFDNKVVVITGAASGMGREYALAFAKLNSKLALCDLDEAGLNETVALVKKIGDTEVYTKLFSVADEAAVYEFAGEVASTLGDASIVINNAGIEGTGGPGWMTPSDGFKRVMDVNLYGVVYCSQAFLPQLAKNKEAALVNVSSVFGMIGSPGSADYCASKFAVRGYTETLMAELNDSHVQVHLVHPGGIKTNIARKEDTRLVAAPFLTTPPAEIVIYVIKGIRNNNPRIVYGNLSTVIRLMVHLLPLKLRYKLLAKMTPDTDGAAPSLGGSQ
ncbi:MAG: NAD(P)-dependent dehydrogenase (short-subunit alcohol dehydrogenase family) [Pseudomonadales bacterium]|jgi:NAD(P)-dependent dehydrogenase (short-subunit alcohol dehydrogenase family)